MSAHHERGRQTVLVVDDVARNLTLISHILRPHYTVKAATCGEQALHLAVVVRPDLILLDVDMPGMDGYAVCRRLKADAATRDIPVIFLTAMTGPLEETAGFDAGAVDYISKPVLAEIMLSRVKAHLTVGVMAGMYRDKASFLEREVARRTEQIARVQEVTLLITSSLAEARDNETGTHILRTQHYVKCLAEHLRAHPRFADQLTGETIEAIFKSAPLHDIGKVGIPDRILLLPDRLSHREMEIMKTHTTIGRDAIERAEQRLGYSMPFLRVAKEMAYCHHERWDGSGYPQGLAGDAIPIAARLMALADVYDALISKRVYKPAMSHDDATLIILAGRGQHFDPDVVDAFEAVQVEFRDISMRFADSQQDFDEELLRLDWVAESP